MQLTRFVTLLSAKVLNSLEKAVMVGRIDCHRVVPYSGDIYPTQAQKKTHPEVEILRLKVYLSHSAVYC